MSFWNKEVRKTESFGGGPSLVKCVRIKRDILIDVARQFAHGCATVTDLEKAATELIEAKQNLLKAVGQ